MMDTTPPFKLSLGDAPLLITMQHVGTHIDPEIEARMQPRARLRADTDWHLERLYDFAARLGATVLAASHSRYVIDVNRPKDGSSLYPGKDTTSLCPVDEFDSAPIYLDGQAPSADEIGQRVAAYWEPFHGAVQAQLTRLRAQHANVVLWDAHSIRSVLPRFFEGRLPDLNFGTADGASCADALAQRLQDLVQGQADYSWVFNGRYKGGHTVRTYGQPDKGVHTVQLELAQASYMAEASPFDYQADKAERLRPLLERLLEGCLGFASDRR